MKILGLIPARKGSKGVPGKNHKLLQGKPLIQYTIESAMTSKRLDSCILSSDDEEVVKIAEQLGVSVPFIRPESLAQDDTPMIAVVQHALSWLEKNGQDFDVLCLLQATSPFRKKGFIDLAIEKFFYQQADSLVSVLPVPHQYNPHWTFLSDDKGLLHIATGDKTIISRRQDLPKAYIRDGSIYLVRTNIVQTQGSLYGSRIGFIESDPGLYVNIDSPEDWHRAEELLLTLS